MPGRVLEPNLKRLQNLHELNNVCLCREEGETI